MRLSILYRWSCFHPNKNLFSPGWKWHYLYKIDNLIFTRVKTRFHPGENALIYKISWKNSYLHTMFWNWRTTTNLWARVKNEVTWPIWTIFSLISSASNESSFGSFVQKAALSLDFCLKFNKYIMPKTFPRLRRGFSLKKVGGS